MSNHCPGPWYHQRTGKKERYGQTNLAYLEELRGPPEQPKLAAGPYAPIPNRLGPTMFTPNEGGPGLNNTLRGEPLWNQTFCFGEKMGPSNSTSAGGRCGRLRLLLVAAVTVDVIAAVGLPALLRPARSLAERWCLARGAARELVSPRGVPA